MEKNLTSGQLAKQAGIHVETLRYYEREGLIPEPERTESGYRQYPPSEVQRVYFIKRAQELGFTLKEIKELLALHYSTGQSAHDVKALVKEKLLQIDAKIQSLQSMHSVLAKLEAACLGENTTTDRCPILHCFTEEAISNEFNCC